MLVANELIAPWLQDTDAVQRPDPNGAEVILIQRPNSIITQAERVVGAILVACKFPG